MRKSNLIQFSIILVLFILYHYLYILFNQSGTINSDTIWSYSFARDIIEGLDLTNFTFPPFYYFFDIIISFIPALFGNHLLHAIIVSPINITIFILIFSSFYKTSFRDGYFESAILLIFSTILVYFLFIILSLGLSTVFDVAVYPLLILKNYFFMQGNHGLSAVAALVLSYLFYFKETHNPKKTILIFFVFLFSLSDFWFAVYFLPIIGILFLLKPNKKVFIEILYLTSSSILALILTFLLNNSLRDYSVTINGYDLFQNIENLLDIMIGIISMLSIIYIVPFLCILHLYNKKKLSNFIKCIFLGSLVSVSFIILTGNFTFYNMRFCVFALPLNIILIFEVLKLHQINLKRLIYISSVFLIFGYLQILSFNITDKMKNNSTHFDFREEVACIKQINKDKNYTIFSSYWPSKVIFENLKRNINLLAVKWIYNPSWSKLYPESSGIIIVKFKHYPENVQKDLVEAIENKKIVTENFCSNKLILVENFKASFAN